MEAEEEKPSIQYQIIRGVTFPVLIPFKREYIEEAMDYVPKDNDIIIASYPKTGTTWMQYIVTQIVSKATDFYKMDDMIYKMCPFFEMTGKAVVNALTRNRMYKHHLPYNVVQKNDNSKCLYIYRHPEDTFVSFFHYLQNLYPEIPLILGETVENFVSGKLAYGSYFKHVLSFYEHRNDSNLLFISYEKLYRDRKNEILRIAKFLDEEHYNYLIKNEDTLHKIIEHTSFDNMKKNLYLTHPDHVEDEEKKYVNFFRKGIIGDGKNSLSEQQRGCIKDAAKAVLSGTSVFQEWYPDED